MVLRGFGREEPKLEACGRKRVESKLSYDELKEEFRMYANMIRAVLEKLEGDNSHISAKALEICSSVSWVRIQYTVVQFRIGLQLVIVLVFDWMYFYLAPFTWQIQL